MRTLADNEMEAFRILTAMIILQIRLMELGQEKRELEKIEFRGGRSE